MQVERRSLFGRIIVVALLGPVPWCLCTPDGLLRKTDKAKLAHSLQKNVSNSAVDEIPDNYATIIDGMSLVQKIRGDQSTYGEVSTTILAMALNDGRKSNWIDVVFDVYVENSIKNSERSLWGEETGFEVKDITSTQKVRQWRSILTRISNKTCLISFIVHEWQTDKSRDKLEGKTLYATVGGKCHKITSEGHEVVPEFQCQQEEADGRLLFHAAHAAKEGFPAVVISSEDTDVSSCLLLSMTRLKHHYSRSFILRPDEE